MNTNKASTGEVINLLFVPVSFNNGLSRKRDRHRSPCQVWWFQFYPNFGLSCHSSPCCQTEKKKYLRSERRIIQGIDVCPAVCLDNGRYQKCFVCGDNTDEVPFISRPALSNAISQTIYPRSQRLHHIYFPGWSNNRDKVFIKDRQNQLLHDPKTTRKKLISIDRVFHRCLLSC